MIFSTFENLTTYKGLLKNLDVAIDYLQSLKEENFEIGKFEVASDDVYCVVSEYNTRGLDEGKYETHERYLDIQCLLEGEENILVTERKNLTSTGYDAKTDKENYIDGSEEACVTIAPQKALILFPEDAHKACCMIGDERKPVRKLLVKVKI